jgi:SAM-dependent methyltransferase
VTRTIDHPSRVNAGVWRRGMFVRAYKGTELRPPEAVLLERHRDALAGRVLELGCGAGRVTRHLAATAGELHALDISAAMVDEARAAVPSARFHVRDMTDLKPFEPGSFDAVVATYNVIDVLDDAERGAQLDRIRALLRPGGTLIMSTHNRAALPSLRGPAIRATHPRTFVADILRLPRRVRNRRRLLPLERNEPGYSIVNDSGHDYSLLHYYIARDDQERQLAEHGFELIECVDMRGATVAPGATAAETSELHYAARRTADR